MDSSGPGGVWSYVDIIGGYMNKGALQQDPENYFMIDALKIDDHYIGHLPASSRMRRARQQLHRL